MTRLKEWLKEKGMTQAQLAAMLGVSRVTVNRVANGLKPGRDFVLQFYFLFGQDDAARVFDFHRKAEANE